MSEQRQTMKTLAGRAWQEFELHPAGSQKVQGGHQNYDVSTVKAN